MCNIAFTNSMDVCTIFSSHGVRVTSHGVRVTSHGVRVTSHGVRVTEYESRIDGQCREGFSRKDLADLNVALVILVTNLRHVGDD